MDEEIQAAVCLMSRLAKRSTRLASGDAERFGQALGRRLAEKYLNHWYPDRPSKGQAYRCIRLNDRQRNDPVLEAACCDVGLRVADLCLPREITLWVDPYEVSCRYGESNHPFTVARFDTPAEREAAALAGHDGDGGGGGDDDNEEKKEEEKKKEDDDEEEGGMLSSDSAMASRSWSSSSTPLPSSDEEEAARTAGRAVGPPAAAGSGGAAAGRVVMLSPGARHGVAAPVPPGFQFQQQPASRYQVAELVYQPLLMWPTQPPSYPARQRPGAPPLMVLGGTPPPGAWPRANHFFSPPFVTNAASPPNGNARRGSNRGEAGAAPAPPPGFGPLVRAAPRGQQQQHKQTQQ